MWTKVDGAPRGPPHGAFHPGVIELLILWFDSGKSNDVLLDQLSRAGEALTANFHNVNTSLWPISSYQ